MPEQQGIVMTGIDKTTPSTSSEVNRKLTLSIPVPIDQSEVSTNPRVDGKPNGTVAEMNTKHMQGDLSKGTNVDQIGATI